VAVVSACSGDLPYCCAERIVRPDSSLAVRRRPGSISFDELLIVGSS
jgi:hypothetical protein